MKRIDSVIFFLVALLWASICRADQQVSVLLEAIKHPNAAPIDLIKAVHRLGQLRLPTAVGPLAKLLKHKNEHVRDEAWYALVRIGKPSVPTLVKLLGNADELPGTVDEVYRNRKYPDFVDSRTPLGWRQIGPGKIFAPVGLYVNRYAVRALGLIGDRSVVLALKATEKKFAANKWIRDECRRARIAISGKSTAIASDMRPWMLAEIGNPAPGRAMADSVSRSLRRTGKGNIAEKFGPYTDFGGSRPVEEVRRLDALGVLGGTATAGPLLRLANEGVRDDWQWFHAGLHDLVDHYHSLGCGWDAHWMAPLAACRALGEGGIKDAVPLLKKRLSDKNILVRLNAARALAQLGDRSGLQTALDGLKWMHPEFVSDYDKKGKPWLQHWANKDQSGLPNLQAPRRPGQTWYRRNPNYQYLVAYDALGYLGGKEAHDLLIKRARQILALRGGKFFNEYYQTDLLWIAAALKRIEEDSLSNKALEGGMELFAGERATALSLRHFHVAALPALAKINDPGTLEAVGRVLAHHQTTWRPGFYDVRDVAWGVYLTLVGRRDPNKPLRCSELCWLH